MALDVAIIGAGFGGIGMAIRLKQAGQHDFLILEQAAEVGGTWRDNTYPGCACDIPSELYSLSFAPSPQWSRRYPAQAEIAAYLRDCIDRFGLGPHLRLNTALRAASFRDGGWDLRIEPGPPLRATTLVLAAGALHRPAIPSLPGAEDFRGAAFHSARWDHAAPLAGKRIAVIGTGASAIQFVPRIAPLAAQLTLFQRSPPWVLAKHDPPAGPLWQAARRRLPLLRRAWRGWLYWSHESRMLGFGWFPALMTGLERRARSHAKTQLDNPALRERLTPADRIGCKRILLSNDYFPSLNRPNVALVTAPIARIAADAVITADGTRHPADVLIYATGFQATDPLGGIAITGRDGVTLAEAWAGRMRARLGLAVPGFPNMFLLAGPNTGLGHNSLVFMLEAQIGHILRCLRLRRSAGAREIEVRAEAEAGFTARLDARMARTVWLSGCRSWYLDRQGRNTTLWPGFSIGYWWRARRVSRRDYALR